MRTRRGIVIGLVVVAALVAVVLAISAARSGLHAGDRYVALGSSFAAGPGLEPIADEGCGRSTANYPARLADELQLPLTDVTCSGATTALVLTEGSEINGVQRPPQIEALTPDTKLVTITIGGNDLGYAQVLEELACIDSGGCPGTQVDRAVIDAELAALGSRLTETFKAVRAKVPDALVVVVSYLQIVPRSGDTCAAIALRADTARYAASIGDRLNAATLAAAGSAGVQVVDGYAASDGHTACAADDPWVSGYPADAITFHPTAAGMAATARLVADTIGR